MWSRETIWCVPSRGKLCAQWAGEPDGSRGPKWDQVGRGAAQVKAGGEKGRWLRFLWILDGLAGLSQHPTHLHTELPDLHLQLPHLGLPLSHRGPQLGHEAAALLSLIVELLVQVVLGRSHLLLLQTQTAQNLL